MNTFLRKIAQVPSIKQAILLSHQGEILFWESGKAEPDLELISAEILHRAILELERPAVSTLNFHKGSVYLHSTSIGYIVVVMSDDSRLSALKDACSNGAEKLNGEVVAKKVLLKMFEEAEDNLKPQFIKALVPYADSEIARVLMQIIADPQSLAQGERDSILLAACRTLGYCSSFEATSSLQQLLTSSDGEQLRLDPFTVEAIQLAIRQLEKVKPSQSSEPPQSAKEVAKTEKQPVVQAVAPPKVPVIPEIVKTMKEQTEIEALVAKEKKPEALSRITELIEKATKEKEFDKAEALVEWLLQIEPMALAESIRATELIEESKVALIDKDFYRIWEGIVEILSTEEFIALYHAMERRNYASGEHLVEQGQIISELYFVNLGRVQLYTHIDGREIPLQLVQEGGILGHGTFFELSVWTSGAKSHGAEVYALTHTKLQALEKKYTGIESKLADYCSHIETSSTHLQKLKRSRRQLERKKVSGKLAFVLLGPDGQRTRAEGRGNLLDISQGGVCFTVHSSKRKNTHQLFGRKVALTMKKSNTEPPIERIGKILAVRDHDIIGNAYSVHIQFDTILTGPEMREIVAFSK